MRRVLRALLISLLLGAPAVAQQLLVNGLEVDGLSTELVRGVSYLPADALAASFGASYSYDAAAETALFEFAGRLLSLRVYASEAAAAADTSALRLGGRELAGTGGLLRNGSVYAPIKPVVQAFGGTVTFLESLGTVMAVFPRARVTGMRVQAQEGSSERLIVSVDGLTSVAAYSNQALGVVQLRFDRSDLDAPQQLSGEGFSRASLTSAAGSTDLRLTLAPEYRYESFAVPNAQGFSLVVDIVPVTAETPERATGRRIVLDPGHGAADPGLAAAPGSEASLTLAFAQRLADALLDQGFDVRLTRHDEGDVPLAARSQQGIGSSLYLSLHAAALPSGQYNLYYLGDVQEGASLELALRENARAALAEGSTGALRRQLLLKLVPDAAQGERYARALSGELSRRAGLRAASQLPVPLAVLEGAAGRGLLLELSPEDLADESLPSTLAEALAVMLEQEGGE